MVSSDPIQQKMEASVFAKLNSSGRPFEEHYVAHIKVWEAARDGRGKKSRYIVLSQTSDGSGFIHKAKLNCNGAFSLGKTWKMQDLREVEVVNSLVFEITPSATTYRWQADNARDQTKFVSMLIRLFQYVTGGAAPLRLIGVRVSDGPALPKLSASSHKSSRPQGILINADAMPTGDGTIEKLPPSPRSLNSKPSVVIWKRPVDQPQIAPVPPIPAQPR
ncbi:uncharacterized protein LAESUDRAFT_757486 [Laetiporus sulphureus 93-53]|uniref:Exocyst complex component Sec3 PIP2-binding N-terminal domain-containing protein n=1 Tax=Laetiporus sulphureus 93-53 TaxID=1314785 RepID=A0A165FCW0_9APHY|nr:uncharacterized protein LAESUDRAFT_757486 [Laetiporus sulphureus 93-53]KZT08778.1 hypothetical protein LAESUDRAFT_757486 [Laetiporus sulphureus 93-53]